MLFILIDGEVEFSINYKKHPIQDRDVVKVANDLGINARELIRNF